MRYLVAAALLIAGLGLLGTAGWRVMDREGRLAGRTFATIVEVEEARRNDAIHRRARFRFEVAGEEYQARSAFEASATWSAGDRVRVRYDPDDPSEASLEGAGQTHFVSFVLAAFGVASLLLSALALVLARNRNRRRREEPSFLR